VVGGSFSGLWAQRALSDSFDVTLVDRKDYFEYTPGVLRLFTQPSHLRAIARPLPRKRNKLLLAEVLEVHPSELRVRPIDGGEETSLPFDYLLLGLGSTYACAPIRPTAREPDLPARQASWDAAAARLAQAQSVLIVGGGPVGVELAAEIVEAHPSISVTLITSGSALCSALPAGVDVACRQWLETRGATLMFDSPVESSRPGSVTLRGGQTILAELVYMCTGAPPASGPLFPSLRSHLDSAGRLIVNENMQVAAAPYSNGEQKRAGGPTSEERVSGGRVDTGGAVWSRVYAMGDVAAHQSREIKVGHTAELNAHVAAANVARAAKGMPLLSYPQGAVGASRSPRVYAVSLGAYDGVVAMNGVTVSGAVSAIAKRSIEWSKVAACEERPVGTCLWHVADAFTAWLSRTLLPPPPAETHEVQTTLLFDGVCLLCSTFVHFVIDHNHDQRIRFCALQSEAGMDILRAHGLPLDVSTVVRLAR
jgi:NADH dehydrogenase FAD-containing subunit